MLFEPHVGQEIVIDGEHRAVVQDELVVETRNGVLAPPFVVDAPAVLDRGDRAWGQATLPPDRDDAPRGVGLHAQRAASRVDSASLKVYSRSHDVPSDSSARRRT